MRQSDQGVKLVLRPGRIQKSGCITALPTGTSPDGQPFLSRIRKSFFTEQLVSDQTNMDLGMPKRLDKRSMWGRVRARFPDRI